MVRPKPATFGIILGTLLFSTTAESAPENPTQTNFRPELTFNVDGLPEISAAATQKTVTEPSPWKRPIAKLPRTKNQVKMTVQQFKTGLSSCFVIRKHEKVKDKIERKIMAKFTINPDGTVQAIHLRSKSKDMRLLYKCTRRRLKGWQFGSAREKVRIILPIHYRYENETPDSLPLHAALVQIQTK